MSMIDWRTLVFLMHRITAAARMAITLGFPFHRPKDSEAIFLCAGIIVKLFRSFVKIFYKLDRAIRSFRSLSGSFGCPRHCLAMPRLGTQSLGQCAKPHRQSTQGTENRRQ